MTDLKPGWLKRDVDRASQRVREWKGQAMTKLDDAGDSQYIAGLKAGYNLGLTENHERLNEIINKRIADRVGHQSHDRHCFGQGNNPNTA